MMPQYRSGERLRSKVSTVEREIVFLDELPTTATGKVLRRGLAGILDR